jgi:6-phosphogluconolactonase
VSGLGRIQSRAALMRDLVVHGDVVAVARDAAEFICNFLTTCVGRENLAVVLSGGATPKALYELLALAPYVERVPWDRVHWFFGDERFVPKDSARSNFRLVRSTLLSSGMAPESNIHRIRTEGLTPEGAANAYHETIEEFRVASGRSRASPLFDIVLLGLGEDGHIASLFPGTGALNVRSVWATPAKSPDSESRITLTYRALESSRVCLFLVAGGSKASILSSVARGEDLPATRLRPQGECVWFVDRAAAGR